MESIRLGMDRAGVGSVPSAITRLTDRIVLTDRPSSGFPPAHGGRFATHYAFAFLGFNIGVKPRNCRVNMASEQRKDSASVETLVRSLSTERCERARAELEASGKTADEDVNRLLRHISLYGFRQPMSLELRIKMRRKIKSLVVRYGIPAIWFTLNPNDITNPVKLRLAAYRSREPAEAEAYLATLDEAYKR